MLPVPSQSRLHQNCSELINPINDTHSLNDTTWCSWSPFGKTRSCCLSPLLLSFSRQGWKGLLAWTVKQPTFCLCCLLSDKDDYNVLLGAVDNAFLVAYAIGMFIR